MKKEFRDLQDAQEAIRLWREAHPGQPTPERLEQWIKDADYAYRQAQAKK